MHRAICFLHVLAAAIQTVKITKTKIDAIAIASNFVIIACCHCINKKLVIAIVTNINRKLNI